MDVVCILNKKNRGLKTERDSYCASFCLYIIYSSKTRKYRNRIRSCCFKFILSNDIITLTFSSEYMTILKTTIDNSVEHVSSTNSSPCEISHGHKPKTASNPRKQKKLLKTNKKKFKDIVAVEGFRLLK